MSRRNSIRASLLAAASLLFPSFFVRSAVAAGEASGANPGAGSGGEPPSGLYAFTLQDIEGHDVSLAAHRGQALVLVNVASKCGFTPQYAGLEKLYREYRGKGLVVLGFPANDFRNQEPGTEAEIQAFCRTKYDVTFPLFAKISVTGDDAHPLYRWLTGKETNPSVAGPIEWNFTKFVVDRRGRVVARFPSRTTPESPEFRAAVEKALAS